MGQEARPMGELAAVKLTDADGCTGSAYDTPLQWGAMVTHTVPEWGGSTCALSVRNSTG